jgi:hypothetical protein
MHGLNNATQLLASLNALVAEDDGEAWLERRSADLARTSGEIEDLGYVLAVLAGASGADLLGERREARGLELVVDLVRAALRRAGADLAPVPTPLPRLARSAGEGWELPWVVGSLLWVSATALPTGEALAWSLEGDGDGWCLRAERPEGIDLAVLAERVHSLLPEARLEVGAEGWSLLLPGRWLEPGAEQAPSLSVS